MAESALEIHGLVPVRTTAASASLVLRSGRGVLHAVNASAGATPGYLMLFDAASEPADGTVEPVKCWYIAANESLDKSWTVPLRFMTGIIAVFSSTGPYTKTASATAFISGEATIV